MKHPSCGRSSDLAGSFNLNISNFNLFGYNWKIRVHDILKALKAIQGYTEGIVENSPLTWGHNVVLWKS